MKTILKTTFPKHRIYDASNKTEKEIDQVIQLCIKIHSILMFIIRNKNNEQFLVKYEKLHNESRIGYMFFNKDDYLYFPYDNKNRCQTGMIFFLRNFLCGTDNECCICYEKFNGKIKNLSSCEKCGCSICTRCIFSYLDKVQVHEMKCPICKSFVFATVMH